MVHNQRFEWVWPSRPATPIGTVHSLRYDVPPTGGHGQLTGLIDRDHLAGDPPPNTAVPIARHVILFQIPVFRKIKSSWSDANGAVTFQCLDMSSTYMVYSPSCSIGETRFEAVCADGLVPELMP